MSYVRPTISYARIDIVCYDIVCYVTYDIICYDVVRA